MSVRRLWWYEVDEVWGFDGREPPVQVGQRIRDRWKPDRTWNILNLHTVTDVGGWHARLLCEAVGEYADRPPTRGSYEA